MNKTKAYGDNLEYLLDKSIRNAVRLVGLKRRETLSCRLFQVTFLLYQLHFTALTCRSLHLNSTGNRDSPGVLKAKVTEIFVCYLGPPTWYSTASGCLKRSLPLHHAAKSVQWQDRYQTSGASTRRSSWWRQRWSLD